MASTPLDVLELNYRDFLDGCTLLFGETKTGKSFIMVDILYHLQPHIDQIIVISPMDRQNHTYDRGLVPLPCIHYTITATLLENIWERQLMLASVYTRSNQPGLLRKLFNRIKGNHEERRAIDIINKKLRETLGEMGDREGVNKEKIADMEKECQQLIVAIFKSSINRNREYLRTQDLSTAEEFSLAYMNVNPRLVIVFDDCTEQLKKMCKHPVVKNLFYQGRWNYITALIACHTDKALDPELKKSAFVSIFTDSSCAHAYFVRGSNDLEKSAIARAKEACSVAFTSALKHQKLVWIREEKTFYRYTASSHPTFKFSCKYIWDFCAKIQSHAGAISSTNRFICDFDVPRA
jgi:hypothetical protein